MGFRKRDLFPSSLSLSLFFPLSSESTCACVYALFCVYLCTFIPSSYFSMYVSLECSLWLARDKKKSFVFVSTTFFILSLEFVIPLFLLRTSGWYDTRIFSIICNNLKKYSFWVLSCIEALSGIVKKPCPLSSKRRSVFSVFFSLWNLHTVRTYKISQLIACPE